MRRDRFLLMVRSVAPPRVSNHEAPINGARPYNPANTALPMSAVPFLPPNSVGLIP
jgi:hypothetical protein